MKYLAAYLLLISSAFAENLYVTPTGAGLANGSSWSNAFAGFSDVAWGSAAGQVGAGDTLWVAAGTYGSLVVGASGTSDTNRVTIRKATENDAAATSSPGWNASFANQANLFNIRVDGKNWFTVDGNRGTEPWDACTANTFGFLINLGSGGTGIDCIGPCTGEQWINIDIQGPGFRAATDETWGIQLSHVGNPDHINALISKCRIQNMDSPSRMNNFNFSVIEKTNFRYASSSNLGAFHPDTIYWYISHDSTVRYCFFGDVDAESIFFDYGQSNNIYFYGNVMVQTLGNGCTAIEAKDGYTWGKFFIYNNTFYGWNRGDPSPRNAIQLLPSVASGSEVKNNIFVLCSNQSTGATSAFNGYWQSPFIAGSNVIIGTNDPFVNLAALNCRLKPGSWPVNVGTPLAATFATDMDGHQRGADGTWDLGAYELSTGGPDVTPPTVLASQAPAINAAGNQLSITFSENVNFGSGGSGGWTLNMSGGSSVMSSPSGAGSSVVTFNLSRVINAGETGTLSYTQPGAGWQDLAPTPNLLASVSGLALANNSTQGPPTLTSATINPAGTQLSLVFSQPVQAGTGGNAGWTLSLSPAASLGTMTGTGSNTLIYNINRVINLGESVTLSYVQPGNGIEAVSSGADLAGITSRAVTNNSTQGQTATPVITLPAGPYFGTQTTTITDADSGAGAVIHYTVDGSTPTASSPVYSAPITISTNQTIRAIATWTGHTNSAPASSSYEVVSWVSNGIAWKTFAVPQKTGTFVWNLSIVAPAAGSDAVVGLGPSPISDYTGMACIIQFAGNTINGINGAGYTTGPAYVPGALYNFVATINTTAHTWTLSVTPASGGATTAIVTNAAFRTEQASAAALSSVGIYALSGTTTTSAMAFPSGASSTRYIGLRGVPAAGGAVP